MKKIIKFTAILLLIAVALSANVVSAFAQSQYEVDGWRTSVSFDSDEDAYKFDFYTEFDKSPWLMDGRLYFWTLAEQKAIYTARQYNDLDVSADFGTINDHGKFDVGFYVHASGAGNPLDQIDAWEVNLERGADDKTFELKLHRFFNYSWAGAKVEVSGLKLPMNTVNLRVVVKSGTLYAFVNYEQTSRISYYIGEASGYVGLRCFYSPNWVDNFAIIGKGNVSDGSLDALLNEAQAIDGDKYTEESRTALNNAINAAENAQGQYRVDEAEKALKEAIDGLMEKQTYQAMAEVISQAKLLENIGGKVYTSNSWRALLMVIERCEAIDENASESEISYWTNRLILKINDLIRYGGAQ